ncbi:MAG: MobF family relaxase [Phycisphaerales bacterium]
MLRIVENTSAPGAKSYYSSSDYYTQGTTRSQELVGEWRGLGAERLGLSGPIGRAAWDRLCDNRHPQSGGSLTARRNAERRVGYDLNWHCPKSVSILYGLTEDPRLLEAFRSSVRDTMTDIEREAKARVRKGGGNEDRLTGNLVWGEFTHLTARPIDGVPDPHLHSHCFVFNATFDPNEKRWKAAQLGDIKRDAPYFEALFHARLARKLEELGLATERGRHGWEIAGLDQGTLSAFSRRTAAIEALAESKGITDPEAKAALGATTRSRKRGELSMEELRVLWRDRLHDQASRAADRLAARVGSAPIPAEPGMAREAVRGALEHCFERSAVVPERVLIAEALKRGAGKAHDHAVIEEVGKAGLLRAERDGRLMVTTKEVLEEEAAMLRFAREGRGACAPINAEFRDCTRSWLNDQQQNAVRHVLHGRDRVMLIRGGAGTGKTTMMQEAREAIEAAGGRVFAFAPSADASHGVLRDEAGFADAHTVARLLVDDKLQEQVRGSVLWIDEAGLLGSRSMRRVFGLAEKLECRVVLSGDRRQHGSVERGSALRLLEDEAGLSPAEIKDIQRQKDAYKIAVAHLAEGRTDQGFSALDNLGWIREIPGQARDQALARAYVDATRSGKSALVVSPTHVEGERITSQVRAELRQLGVIHGAARGFPRLIPQHFTLGEKLDPVNYRPGDVLVFHQNATGYTRGQRITLGSEPPPVELAERFTVYRAGAIDLAAGDRVRITKNGRTVDGGRLCNGDLFTVKDFTRSGDLVLSSKDRSGKERVKVLAADYGHLDHGFVVTSHASQGKTVDRVFIGQSSRSFAASSREQFYVSASRGREQALVFTDDKAGLLDAVRRGDDRLSGTELVRGAQLPKRPQRVRHGVVRSRVAQLAQRLALPPTPVKDREFEHGR